MKLTYSNQKKILTSCIAKGEELADVLHGMGGSYDSLVYYGEEGFDSIAELPDIVPVDARPKVAPGIPCVSFFFWCGRS